MCKSSGCDEDGAQLKDSTEIFQLFYAKLKVLNGSVFGDAGDTTLSLLTLVWGFVCRESQCVVFEGREDIVSIEGFEWDEQVDVHSNVTLHGERHRGVAFETSQLQGDVNINEQQLGEATARPAHKPEAHSHASRPEDIDVQFGEMS